MIDRHTTSDDLYDWLFREYETPPHEPINPAVFDRPHERVSELLGPDGEPLTVPYPRRALGFDLRPKGMRE